MMAKVKNVIAVFSLFLLAGCQASGAYYLGALADGEGEPVVVAVAQQQTQSWEDLYLVINSDLFTMDGQQQLSGTVEFSFHSQGMYGRVGSLDLRVFLLDVENRVVAYHPVMRFLGLSTRDQVSFRVILPETPNAVAYTFGYEATFADIDEAVTTWNLPSRQR